MEDLSWDSESPVAIRTTNFPLKQQKRRTDEYEYEAERQHNVSDLCRGTANVCTCGDADVRRRYRAIILTCRHLDCR